MYKNIYICIYVYVYVYVGIVYRPFNIHSRNPDSTKASLARCNDEGGVLMEALANSDLSRLSRGDLSRQPRWGDAADASSELKRGSKGLYIGDCGHIVCGIHIT